MSADAAAVQDMLKVSRRNPYTYPSTAIAALAAGGAAATALQFEVDSIFVWTKTSYHADIAGAAYTASTIPVPLVTVQIQDTATQRTIFFTPVPIEDMAGSLGLPFVLPAPAIITPAAAYKFSFVNFSAATTYANLQIFLHGFKFYGQLTADGRLVSAP